MSFRKEEKLHIHKNQLHFLLEWIVKNGGKKLYDTRVVSSTYFDNEEMQMFKDSEEGSVPRKKIRIRSYSKKNHEIGDSSLEIKTSSVEGRFKTSNKKFDLHKALYMGVFDPDYGVCKPKVRVSYKRDYYKIHDVRLTIDRQIEYTKLDSRGVGIYRNYDTDIIVEVKAGDFIPIEYLMRKFHFDRVRFSKYSRAILAV
ncbi:VTC domain-containing protein [Gammaproteobacteria bacterium]|nr:VTC domain-containing protein [Gammaproteobacteria bacterium]